MLIQISFWRKYQSGNEVRKNSLTKFKLINNSFHAVLSLPLQVSPYAEFPKKFLSKTSNFFITVKVIIHRNKVNTFKLFKYFHILFNTNCVATLNIDAFCMSYLHQYTFKKLHKKQNHLTFTYNFSLPMFKGSEIEETLQYIKNG